MWLERIGLFCFGASYALALALELLHLFRPRPVLRWLGMGCGAAGLLAHTLFLGHALFWAEPRLSLATSFGSLLFLAWILAIFYLYGTLHHRNQAWAVFVLPLVLGLIVLARFFPPDPNATPDPGGEDWFLGALHGALLLLAAVGVCVGFLASVMYLIQSRRLQAKKLPGKGLKLLSLERLEAMNRRAIVLAFPLLTAGVVVGVIQLFRINPPQSWADPRIWGVAALWLVFALLLYLRFGYHLRGRRVALLTIVAFVVLVCTLATSHTVVQGVGP